MLKINSKISPVRILSGLIIAMGLILLVMAITAKVASQNNPVDGINTPLPSVAASPEITAEIIKNNSISYVIDAGNGQKIYDGIYYLEKSTLSNLNVFTVLDAISEYGKKFDIEYKNYDFGIFVQNIGGVKNETDGKSWMYYVNDALGQVAADKQELKAGDKVEWRFEKAEF